MKNRKTVIVVFMLLAAMVLSVGYAALTDDLLMNGSASVNTEEALNTWDEVVYFSEANAVSTTGNSGIADKAEIGATSNGDSVIYEVKSLAEKDQYAVFKFTVKNDSTEYDAQITVDTGYPTNNNEEYFRVTYDYGTGIAAKNGGTLEITVTVTLLKSPTTNLTASFKADITATSIEPTPTP